MDRTSVFTKTAKGLMEATGKTSVLSRDMRTLLKEIDGKATLAEVHAKFPTLPEAKLQEALKVLAREDFVREFSRAAQTAAPPAKTPAAPPPSSPAGGGDMDLDFTTAIPTMAGIAKQAEEAAKQQAQTVAAAAAAEAAARAKAEADARAKAAAEAAARARAEAELKAKDAALEKAKAAAAEAAARARAEADARAKAEAEAAARAKAEAEARGRAEAEARARAEAEAKAEAEARARKEAEERARVEAELKAKLEEERKAREEAERMAKEQAERERREVEEKARREADELRAKLAEERKAREEAERKAKEQVERERKEAEEKAQREADELRAKIEEERSAREEAERKVKEQAERERKEAEEKARREADELRAKIEEERKAREETERKAKEDAERRTREDSERRARDDAERSAREQAEREAKEKAEREAKERTERETTEQAERVAREQAEREAKEQAERVRREAEERERREAEERSRIEAEAKTEADTARAAAENARRAAAEQAGAQAAAASGRSLDDLVKIEVDFDAVQSAPKEAKVDAARPPSSADDLMLKALEEKARKEAEEKARSEAEEKTRKEAEAKEKQEEEESRKDEKSQSPGKSERKPRAQAAAPEREFADAKARLEAQDQETERHFTDMEKELDAEAAGGKDAKGPPERREDARQRDKEAARERALAEAALRADEAGAAVEDIPAEQRTPINWGKPAALGLFLILILGLVSIHFVSFNGQIPQFEKLAGAHLQQPVKIKALHLALVPLPHWRLDGVSVGNEGQLTVAQIKAVAEIGSMFGETKAFKSIELESPVLSEEALIALLFGKPQGQDLKIANVIVKNGKLNSKTVVLPVLDAKIVMDENGAPRKIALETPDRKTSLVLEPKGEEIQLEVETNAFSMPFGPAFILDNFSAKGTIGRNELKLAEFKGGIHGGYLSGSANLKWGADYSLGGEVSARAMDPGRIAPALLEEGKLEGKAVYAMRAKTYDDLFAAPRLEGTFEVQKGALLGVDLTRLLQGGGPGGKTAFTELTGSFVREGGRTQLRQVRLAAGPVSAGGSADVDGIRNISGRFAVELKSPVAQARANLTVSGNLREPRFSR